MILALGRPRVRSFDRDAVPFRCKRGGLNLSSGEICGIFCLVSKQVSSMFDPVAEEVCGLFASSVLSIAVVETVVKLNAAGTR